MEKISVIVPFFNGEKTLDRCIESILAQTYTNFELIMVDDGSTDGSCAVVEKYAQKDKRIKLVNKAHAGVSAARNLGLDIADGDFIQFIDADDYVEPEMFETMLNAINKAHADIAVCNHTHPCITNYLGNRTLDFSKKKDLLIYYQNTFAAHLPWNKLFRRSVITDKFDESISFCEDGMFCLANMKNAKKVVSIGKKLYHYYVAPPTTSLEESSCINKMAKAPDFWQTKNTFWYMRDALMDKSRQIVEKHFPAEDIEDFIY
ncbi:MAG: glycosyltransferase family 2 protein, partial [Eubacteriales bacterium]